jgi:hypothetical protein
VLAFVFGGVFVAATGVGVDLACGRMRPC